MGQPYVGEIRMFAGNFAPSGWAFCDGQTMAISQNEVLFQLIGTTYGGDGQQTFDLPNLQSRVPMHMGTGQSGSSYIIGERAGVEAVTLTVNQIPSHTHLPACSTTEGNEANPAGGAIWATANQQVYAIGTDPAAQMANGCIAPAGGSQPHDNMHPFLAINFIISLFGIFPSQN